jgi:hypothetical protein
VVDIEKQKKDSSLSFNDEKESDYPGGLKSWQRYMLQNLKYSERAMNWE